LHSKSCANPSTFRLNLVLAHQPLVNGRFSLSHAIRVKSAEYWLRLGEADEALRELEALPKHAWNHPAAVKVRVAALEVLGETGAIVEEVPA
jgi:hypothetical protein